MCSVLLHMALIVIILFLFFYYTSLLLLLLFIVYIIMYKIFFCGSKTITKTFLQQKFPDLQYITEVCQMEHLYRFTMMSLCAYILCILYLFVHAFT